MKIAPLSPCDADLLNRYPDGQLDPDEKAQFEEHLAGCESCRREIELLAFFSQEFRRRIDLSAESIDFTALEKEVVVKAVRQHRPTNGSPLRTVMKVVVPAVATTSLLLGVVYWQFTRPSDQVPSAIINSFTGPISSVMIFETPNTHQTILWYNEATDAESEKNAV